VARVGSKMAGIVLPFVVMTLGGNAVAGVHHVWDEAHFLKPQSVSQIDQVLADIHGRFGKDLMIETFPSIPDDLKQRYQEQGKEKFYEGWTRSEAFQLGVNGVMVLVTGDPPHLQVEVGLETRQKAFTLDDRNELVDILVKAFEKKDFDGGMLQAAEFVRDRTARNLGGGAAGPTSRPTTQPSEGPAPAGSTSRADGGVAIACGGTSMWHGLPARGRKSLIPPWCAIVENPVSLPCFPQSPITRQCQSFDHGRVARATVRHAA